MPKTSNFWTCIFLYDSLPESQCNVNFNLLQLFQVIRKQLWNFGIGWNYCWWQEILESKLCTKSFHNSVLTGSSVVLAGITGTHPHHVGMLETLQPHVHDFRSFQPTILVNWSSNLGFSPLFLATYPKETVR